MSVANPNSLDFSIDEDVLFFSFGMFIIDEIEYHDGTILKDIVGGGGTYATYGARYFTKPPRSRGISWIIDVGSDFPQDVRKQLEDLYCSFIFREDLSRLTTRGWNGYEANGFRAFKYLTPKRRLTVDDMLRSRAISSKTYHLLCSPERAKEIVQRTIEERKKLTAQLGIPMFAWEPIPDLCTPEYLESCFDVLPMVDILTPNSAEAAAFFGLPEPDTNKGDEEIAARFLPFIRDDAAVVIRAGQRGCLVLTKTIKKWLPVYHNDPSKVVDLTGAGNSFVGGMCMGYLESKGNYVEAASYGNIAAALAIEQLGFPRRTTRDGEEYWNGVSISNRLQKYKSMLVD
ncbi:Ribokinase-like protein [Dipodascopsis uninucleata]